MYFYSSSGHSYETHHYELNTKATGSTNFAELVIDPELCEKIPSLMSSCFHTLIDHNKLEITINDAVKPLRKVIIREVAKNLCFCTEVKQELEDCIMSMFKAAPIDEINTPPPLYNDETVTEKSPPSQTT